MTKDIRDAAMKEFKDLSTLAENVPDVYAGRIYSVAQNYLKLALAVDIHLANENERKLKREEKWLARGGDKE